MQSRLRSLRLSERRVDDGTSRLQTQAPEAWNARRLKVLVADDLGRVVREIEGFQEVAKESHEKTNGSSTRAMDHENARRGAFVFACGI